MIKSAGGVVRAIPLKPSKSGIISSADWKLDPVEFEKLFNNKTKMLILNTPHNPRQKRKFSRHLRTHQMILAWDRVQQWSCLLCHKIL